MRTGVTDRLRSVGRALVLSLLAAASAAPSVGRAATGAGQEAEGVWVRDDGLAKIEFSSCGSALCGAIVWLKNPEKAKAKIGQRIFFDMTRADSNSWTGNAFNPEDGKTYSGKMVISGRKLRTSGCVFGGLICKTVYWIRPN